MRLFLSLRVIPTDALGFDLYQYHTCILVCIIQVSVSIDTVAIGDNVMSPGESQEGQVATVAAIILQLISQSHTTSGYPIYMYIGLFTVVVLLASWMRYKDTICWTDDHR